MRFVDLLHRWAGGLIGLVLALLGISGAILVHKDDWISLPHAGDARLDDPGALGRVAERLLGNSNGGESLIFASDRFGLIQQRAADGGGYYASQTGDIVARWSSQWERPELWLFDLHHHLFAGESGEIVIGIAGLAAIAFVITGAILWWRTRRTFKFRLWPARMTTPAIRMHHRDLGIVFAPLLLLVALTGTMMIFRPVAAVVVSPLSSPARVLADLSPPTLKSGKLATDIDWNGLIGTAHRLYPDAQLRIVSLPRKIGDPITVRLKQPEEWLPNGRTMIWFDAANGRLISHRDALAMAPGTQAFNMAYPLHAAKVGGLPYRLVMTLCGLALTLLGSLAVWTFWLGSSRKEMRRGVSAASE